MFSEHTSQFVLKLSQLGSFLLVLFLASILLRGAVLLSLYNYREEKKIDNAMEYVFYTFVRASFLNGLMKSSSGGIRPIS